MKIIVVRIQNELICAALFHEKIVALERESADMSFQKEGLTVGSVYVGRVENCVSSLQAAFVRFSSDEIGYLPFSRVPAGALFNREYDGRSALKPGDMLAVQVERLKSGMKQTALTGFFSLSSKLSAITYGTPGVAVSKKISDALRAKMRDDFQSAIKGAEDSERIQNELLRHALTIRTDAKKLYDTDETTAKAFIVQDVNELLSLSADIRKRACSLSAGSLVYRPDPNQHLEDTILKQIRFLRNLSPNDSVDIVCEDKEICELLTGALSESEIERTEVRLYTSGEPSLDALYRISEQLKELQKRIVWLRSGGFLVIDKTEAMTVIDVNSGKNIQKKKDDFLSLNKEAAEEAFRQLRLRDLTGIIIIDFINMRNESSEQELKKELKRLASLDYVKTRFIDFTLLGLAELTRDKH